nr:NAD(P)H-dependent oxidoreductase [Roseivirga sp. E12]
MTFDHIYKNLLKLKGNKGLSNSEVALAAALWAAKQVGAAIDCISLSELFETSRNESSMERLRIKLLEADAVLISTPVYFGDRSSLAQSLIRYISQDPVLKEKLKGKVYGGIAVGAKRNGGQETTLIYQLWDLVNIGFLGVGNDSETTSQYGGTGLAGDIGTMSEDHYGLETAMGTGRRVTEVAKLTRKPQSVQLKGECKIAFWILQDKDDKALNFVKKLNERFKDDYKSVIIPVHKKKVQRCIGCDICPTHIDIDEKYRCIINSPKDDFSELHPQLLESDAIIPVVYSSHDTTTTISNYQKFIERTRYIRRGDYALNNLLISPMVCEEIGANQSMAMRMMSSMLRHHTVVSKPLVLYYNEGAIINSEAFFKQMSEFIILLKDFTTRKLKTYLSRKEHFKYKPIGYVLSVVKEDEDERLAKRSKMIEDRIDKNKAMAEGRLEFIDNKAKSSKKFL